MFAQAASDQQIAGPPWESHGRFASRLSLPDTATNGLVVAVIF
jgi:hypothetical protein